MFCLNPWHFERSDPAILALTTSINASASAASRPPHQCDVRLRIGSTGGDGKESNGGGGDDACYVCPICQANKVWLDDGQALIHQIIKILS